MQYIFSLIIASFIVLLTEGNALAQQNEAAKILEGASAEAGKQTALRCKACHTLEQGGPHKLGPNLWDMVGRKQAATEGYKYSKSFSELKGTWTLTELDRFLKDPRSYAPGNRMGFPGLRDDAQRHDLLAYLTTLSTSQAARSISQTGAALTRTAPKGLSLADELGLPQGEGREEVAAVCAACHSLNIVKQQGLDADRWSELMDWMTEKQGMPALAPDDQEKIVAYLALHYGPGARTNRMSPMNPMMPRMPLPPAPPQ